MTRFAKFPSNLATLAARTLVVSLFLAAPVLAVPVMDQSQHTIIEAPAPANTGLGFVLLNILQRR